MGLVTLSLVSWTLAASPPDRYADHQLVEVEASDLARARLVERISTHLLDENLHTGRLRALVDASGRAALDVAGLPWRVLEPDVYGRLVAERERIEGAPRPRDFDEWFAEFKTLDEIRAQVDALAALDPDRVTVVELGQSIESRPIEAVRVGDGEGPAVLITGVQHAREWIASMVPMCVLDHLVRNPDDSTVLDVLARADLYIVPIVNPDGFVYTWENDRYWRKNRRNGTGVDLNRNWAEGWGLDPGSSADPESDQFHGAGAFSEPETAAVRDFIQSHEIAALIDFHSFAAVVSSSWAYTDEAPEDIALLRAWGDGLAAQINSHHDYGYRSLHGMEANETIGYAAGTQPDWTHANLGVPAFTIELRPRFDDPDGGDFELPPELIVPTCDEVVPAVLDLARWATGSEAPHVSIVQPADGTVFETAPAFTDIEIAVDYAGPLSMLRLEIDGQLQDWNDPVHPHTAGIELPAGTWELVAHAQTWDGAKVVSAPVTVTVGEPAGDTDPGSDDDGGTGESDSGGVGTGDEDETGDASAEDPLARGCGCRGTSGPLPALFLLPGLLLRRRRR